MRPPVRAALLLGAAAIAGALAAARPRADDPAGGLAVRAGNRWSTFWRPETAPAVWTGASPLADRVSWREGERGIEWGELVLRGPLEAWRTRVVIARVDPRRVDLSL